MSINHKEIWRGRIVRMSDQLWDEVKAQANLKGVCAAEFVRLALQEEFDKPEGGITHKDKVVSVYTKSEQKRKKTKSVYTGKYACGCKRGETKLCPKHHRS